MDSNATGLLIVGLGKSTKLLKYFINKPKSYLAEIYFGKQTATDDSLGNMIKSYSGLIDFNKIEEKLSDFKGRINQKPPDYSSVHVNGVRSYKLALKNIKPDVKSRIIEIFSYRIVSFESPILTIEIDCSSGTYIRSIARDLGLSTGYYAHLHSLKRSKIDSFELKDSYTIDDISGGNYKLVSPYDACKDFCSIEIKKDFIKKIINGVQISDSWFKTKKNIKKDTDLTYKLHYRKNLLAIVKYNNGNFFYDLVY